MMLNIKHNQLSYSHLLYLPIVFSGIVLGPFYGIAIGIVSGITVGPLMPRFLDTGTPQYFWDWFFRLLMFAVVGYLVGVLSKNYKEILEKIEDAKTKNPESGINNINYLRKIKLTSQQTYTFVSFTIFNHETIRDVIGHEAYYDYLVYKRNQILDFFPRAHVVQSTNHSLWAIFEQIDLHVEVQNFVELMQKHYNVDGQKIYVDFTCGFSSKKYNHQTHLANAFTQADLAAEDAKENYLIYSIYSDLRTKRQFEYELLADFNESLGNGDIYLVYQPKIDLKTRKPSGLEALIRWEHPKRRMIAPDQFIPAIEKTSMIHDMTQHVFDWALTYHAKLLREDIKLPISINISTKNLYDQAFFEKMVKIFNKYAIQPSLVEFEITETVLMEDPELSKRTLEKFSQFGFKIAIDDFGKGYSSLAYLAQFPINTIKIDKFFSKQILINPTTQAIVKATIDLAKQLGYEVLIEGIEDIETADMLERLGCHSAQGYYFMRPRREEDILTYLNRNK